MLTVEIDPIVYIKLEAAFPKPAGKAKKSLDKMKVLLEAMLFKCLQRGRDNFEVMFNLYSLPVDELNQSGPTIKKIRLNKWLNDNGLALIKKVEVGSNITGLVSRVKCTEYMRIKTGVAQLSEKIAAATTPAELDLVLGGDAKKNAELFAQLYPDYFSYLSVGARDKVFDTLPVDVVSLKKYIMWLCTDAKYSSLARLETYTQQAMQILCIANHTNGFYFQRKKHSDFGRTYYEGVSVQNVNKTLRRALLGNSWEYDIRCSVVAWKLNLARELSPYVDPMKDYHRNFWASYLYLEARDEFFSDVRNLVFKKASGLSLKSQNKEIKKAVTAISFGARANISAWKSINGKWVRTAIAGSFFSPQQREDFLQSYTIQSFIQEQSLLDEYLADGLRTEMPDLYYSDLLSSGKRPSKSKAVAYMYQHSETQVMNVARTTLAKHGIKTIANIHDAFVVRKKLSSYVRDDVLYEMQTQTNNKYWRFKAEQLEGFG
jgi:hypothetical protein